MAAVPRAKQAAKRRERYGTFQVCAMRQHKRPVLGRRDGNDNNGDQCEPGKQPNSLAEAQDAERISALAEI
jgi:hypothetical protein